MQETAPTAEQEASEQSDAPAVRVPMTREAVDRLRQELESLRETQRPALRRQVTRAGLFADPAQGEALVTVARHDLERLDRQVTELEALLARVDPVDPGPDPTAAGIGTELTVRDADGTEEALELVGPLEADPVRGRISSDSTAGRALLGKQAGAKVKIGTGSDALDLTVVAVKRAKDRDPGEQPVIDAAIAMDQSPS